MASLHEYGMAVLRYSPALKSLRGQPGAWSWGERLLELAQSEELAPLQNFLEDIVADELTTLEPWEALIEQSLKIGNIQISYDVAGISQNHLDHFSHAAFLLATVALLLWSSGSGSSLTKDFKGTYHPGWGYIPYVWSKAALKIGEISGAMDMAQMAFDQIQISKYREDSHFRATMERYRCLMGSIERRYSMAYANLADEIRELCTTEIPNYRAEIGALSWALGLIPESRLFKSHRESSIIFSRRFFKHLVQRSLTAAEHDGLFNYIWLEIKKRALFDVEAHAETLLHIKPDPNVAKMSDDLMVASPDYALFRSLYGWFKGELDTKQMHNYLRYTDLSLDSLRLDRDPPEPLISEPLIRIRMRTLQYMFMDQLNLTPPDHDKYKAVSLWYGLIDTARQAEQRHSKNPALFEVVGLNNFGVFYLIETIFGNAGEPPELILGLRNSLMGIEELRAGKLAYALNTTPPLMNFDIDEELAKLISEEEVLIKDLRGAVFLLTLEKLPGHYRRYVIHGDDAWEALDDPERQLTAETGEHQLQSIESKLQILYERMRKHAPKYVRQRLDPHAEWYDIVEAMTAHSPSTKPSPDKLILEGMARYHCSTVDIDKDGNF